MLPRFSSCPTLTCALLWALVSSAAVSAQETASTSSTDTQRAPADASAKAKAAFELVEVKANNLKNLRSAMALYRAAIADQSLDKKTRIAALVDMARAQLRIGDLLKQKKARIAAYERGADYARQAQALDDKHADALFWETANLASIGQTKGVMNTLFMVPDTMKKIERVLKLDPNHHYARETLARVYDELPGIVGGDDDKAEALFLEVLKRDPNFTPTKVQLAEFYARQGDDEKAIRLFREVLNAKRSSVPNDYRKYNRPHAKRRLKELEGK